MIVKKHYTQRRQEPGLYRYQYRACVGWFLFGFLPLYIVKSDWGRHEG